MSRILAIVLQLLLLVTSAQAQEINPAETDWTSLEITLSALRTWGTRHYSYSYREPGAKEPSIISAVTMATEVTDDTLILRDIYETLDKGEKKSGVMVHTCRKDNFLSPIQIEIKGDGNIEAATLVAIEAGGTATVRSNGQATTREIPDGTITTAAMMRLVTLVPRTPGMIFSYRYSLESGELNLKKNHRLIVLQPETINSGERQVKCSKFQLTGDGINPAYFWVTTDGVLQRAVFDERKVLELYDAPLVLAAISVQAEDKPEGVLDRAERLVSLRDRVVAEYGSWSEEYAKEDTQFAKKQRAHYEQFGKRVNSESNPAAIPTIRSAVQLRFISVSSMLIPDNQGVRPKTVLDLSSGTLHEGPDMADLKRESTESGQSLTGLLAREVAKSGDVALLEYSFLIPSGKYVNLGTGNLHYYSGVDLSGSIKEHNDPTCIVRNGDILAIETTQKKYALIQYLGKYQKQPLLGIAYQPNGSAVFEFGSLTRVKELDLRRTDINPQDVATAMFLQNREIFFWKEVQALAGPLKNAEKDAGHSESQRERAKQIKKKLGIAE